MGKWAYEVEVAYYGPWFWAGWEVEFAAAEAEGEEDEG